MLRPLAHRIAAGAQVCRFAASPATRAVIGARAFVAVAPRMAWHARLSSSSGQPTAVSQPATEGAEADADAEVGENDDDGEGGASDGDVRRGLYAPSVPITGRVVPTPKSGADWRELAHSMTHPQQTVVVDGAHYSQVECIMRALQFEPKDALLWYELGCAIVGGARVGAYTAAGSFQQSVTLNANNAAAWLALGSAMSMFDVVLVGDQPISRQTCFEKCIALDEKNALAWMCLADHIDSTPARRVAIEPGTPDGPVTATIGGRAYTALDCAVRVLELEPERFPAWNNVALILMKGEGPTTRRTIAVRGIVYSVAGCFTRALELDGTFAFVWRNLAACIPVEAEFKVTVGQRPYTRAELIAEAERLEREEEEKERM
jgi:hypothetical protein